MPWNPSAPDSIGMEFAPTRLDTATVGSDGAAFAVAFTAETTRPLVSLGAGLQVTSPGDWTIELFTEADYLAQIADLANISHVTFNPTSDRHWTGSIWTYPTNVGAGNFWSQIGGTPGSGQNTNWLVAGGPTAPAPTTGHFYAARYDTLAIPAAMRLLALRQLNDRLISNIPDPNNASAVETPFADPVDYSIGRITGEERPAGLNQRQTVTYTFRPRNVLASSNHPATLATWTGTNSGFGFFLTSYSGVSLQMECYHLQLVADYTVERRMAWATGVPWLGGTASGQIAPGSLGDVWSQIVTRGGGTQTITAGQRYVLLVRGPKFSDRSPFVARLPTLTPGPPLDYVAGRVKCDANGLPTQRVPLDRVGVPLYTGTPPGPVPPGVPSVIAPDAMPFVFQGVHPVLGPVPVLQSFEVTAPTDVGQIVVPVARPSYEGSSPLMFRIETTGGVAEGGAVFLDSARWEAIPNPFTLGGRIVKNVRLDLPSTVTLAAGTWRIRISTIDSYALDEVTPWGVLYLESTTPTITPTPGFQPAGQGGRNSGILLVSQPVGPTSFTATREVLSLLPPTDGCAGTWDAARLDWEPPVDLDVEDFLRYEIERLDTAEEKGGTWERIVHVEDPAASTFLDREGRRGELVRYRIRVMRLDGGTSRWLEAAAPFTTVPYCCGIGLVTNYDSPPSLVFTDVETLRTYSNLDAEGLVTRPVYGRDYQLAFHPAERRGVRLETQILVHSGRQTDGLPTFDALRELARADVPSITVLDELGTRFYAAIAVPELTFQPTRGLQVYYSSLTAVQVEDRPIVMTIPRPPPSLTATGTFHLGPHANDRLDSNFFLGFN